MWVLPADKEIWAGDERYLDSMLSLVERINATDIKAFVDSDAGEPPSMLQRHHNVGIIPIKGPLYASVPEFIKAIFGVRDYGDISAALVEAAQDPEIGAILLDVNSPGGQLSSLLPVVDLVSTISDRVKPVHAHTDTLMASAAYWLSSGAATISAARLAEVGSIGVLTVHQEYSKALEQEGVKATILRSGKYKALLNSIEPLTDIARSDIQSKLDYVYNEFIGHVAEQRQHPVALADAQFGQGRTFFGEQAKAVDLVDSVSTFAQALEDAQAEARAYIDKRKSLINNPKNNKKGY